MEWIAIVAASLFVILGFICVIATLFGLPGPWIMLGMALLMELLDRYYLPLDDRQTFPWWLLIACVAFGVLGEILEFIAGALGAKRAGSTSRGVWGALIGGLVGAVLGLALPLPLVGSLIGAFLGTFAGAVAGELSHSGSELRNTFKPAAGATLGRILGTLAKLPIAAGIWLSLSIAAFWR